jgi:heat shock protein HslJ
MKRILLIVFAAMFALNAQSQKSDTVQIKGEEYIPVEGRGQTPKSLEGNWILSSGLKATNKAKSKEYYEPKSVPGEQNSPGNKKKTTTKKGVTTMTSETTTGTIVTPGKQITPPQGANLHKPEKPQLSFYGLNQTFTGFTGCNRFAGRYSISGNKINLASENPSTKMVCIGDYDESDFLSKLKRVRSFTATGNRLELKGNGVDLIFLRK